MSRQHIFVSFLLASFLVDDRMVDSYLLAAVPPTHSFLPQQQLLLSHHERHHDKWRKATTELFSSRAQAGSDGYSVLRQPVSGNNWNPEQDPQFEVPSSLDDDETSSSRYNNQLDDQWWQKRQQQERFFGDDESEKRRIAPTTYNTPQTTNTQTEEELDLFQRSLDTLDFPRVLRALQQECTTAPAKHLVHQAAKNERLKHTKSSQKMGLAYQPLLAESVEGCRERYGSVQEMEWILDGGLQQGIDLGMYKYQNTKGYKEAIVGRPPPLGGWSFDIEGILGDPTGPGRVLEADEILEVSSMMDAFENIILWGDSLRKIEELDFVQLPKLTDCMQVNATLQDLLHNAFDKDGKLSGATFPTVGMLRSRVRELKADVMAKLETLLAMPSIKSKLALESGGPLYSEVNGGRLVIPIEPKHAATIGIVHDSSRSGKTVYVEPTEIISPTNELRQTEGELRSEEARVWRTLTAEILDNRQSLETSAYAAGQLDLVLARRSLGRTINGVVPEVHDEGVICVRDAKHPVLLLREIENVVGSDVELGADGNQGLVLTGPNSGGKTIILKLLGLYALMSRGGIPVPAAPSKFYVDAESEEAINDTYSPRVDFFEPVLADIGDIQSVGGDLSTFSGHMLVCREVLSNAGENALVLMDELGSGTDPAQGVAIAQALLESLVEVGSRVVITTHYMQLKQLAASDDRFAVAGMQFVKGMPTYRLLPGTVGESFALAVAERLKLPEKVLLRASELLDSETRQMGDLIRELEDQKSVLADQVLEIEEKKRQIEEAERKIKEEQIRIERKQLGVRRDEARKFAKKLEEKERVLEDVLSKLKADPSRRVVAKSWDDIKFVKRDAINEAENVPSVVANKQKADQAVETALAEMVPLSDSIGQVEVNEGDMLVVCKKGPLFGREAMVTKVLNGRVEVKVNNMNVAFKYKEVAIAPKSTGVPVASAASSSSPYVPAKRSRSNSISKAAERAIAAEQGGKEKSHHPSFSGQSPSNNNVKDDPGMRTLSNTIDVRGCNLEEAKDRARTKFSSCLMSGRPVVFILHGHGTGGVLKSKIRNWLKTERDVVRKWKAAEASDGGDAFTKVELK